MFQFILVSWNLGRKMEIRIILLDSLPWKGLLHHSYPTSDLSRNWGAQMSPIFIYF